MTDSQSPDTEHISDGGQSPLRARTFLPDLRKHHNSCHKKNECSFNPRHCSCVPEWHEKVLKKGVDYALGSLAAVQ